MPEHTNLTTSCNSVSHSTKINNIQLTEMKSPQEEWQQRQRNGLIPPPQPYDAQEQHMNPNNSNGQQRSFHGFHPGPTGAPSSEGAGLTDSMAAAAFMANASGNSNGANMGNGSGRMMPEQQQQQQQLDLESRMRGQNYPGSGPGPGPGPGPGATGPGVGPNGHGQAQEFPPAATSLFQQLQMQQQRQQDFMRPNPQMFPEYQQFMNQSMAAGNYWAAPGAGGPGGPVMMQGYPGFAYHDGRMSEGFAPGGAGNRVNFAMRSANFMQHQGPPPLQYDQIIQKDAINKHDVLCGRGGVSNTHVGNVSYREMVNKYKAKYRAATKKQKPLIAKEIVENIRNLEPSGRFLKKVKDHVGYEIIGDGEAIQKACQSLREGASKRKQYDEKAPANCAEDANIDPTKLEAPTQTFEDYYKQLQAFKEKHGHLKITEELDDKLCAYCRKMRLSRYNETISSEMISKLDVLGFDWEFQTSPKKPENESSEPSAGDKRKLEEVESGAVKEGVASTEEPDAKKSIAIKEDLNEEIEKEESKVDAEKEDKVKEEKKLTEEDKAAKDEKTLDNKAKDPEPKTKPSNDVHKSSDESSKSAVVEL